MASVFLVTVRCTGTFVDGDGLGEYYIVRIRDKHCCNNVVFIPTTPLQYEPREIF
jgi:hypothetical protein